MKVTVERAGAAEVAGPCPSRGRAAKHDSDPRQCADQGGSLAAQLQGDRSRSRDHRDDRGRGRARRLDHGAGAHVLRDRAQAARRRPDRARGLRRSRGAGDPRRPFALHAADAARERFSRSRRRRHDQHLQADGRRSQAPDRQDPVRDLDRGNPLLSQRHLPAHRRHRQGGDVARGRDRRPSAGAGRVAAAGGRRRHAGRDRPAQDRRRGAAADRGQRRPRSPSSCRRARCASPSATWCSPRN